MKVSGHYKEKFYYKIYEKIKTTYIGNNSVMYFNDLNLLIRFVDKYILMKNKLPNKNDDLYKFLKKIKNILNDPNIYKNNIKIKIYDNHNNLMEYTPHNLDREYLHTIKIDKIILESSIDKTKFCELCIFFKNFFKYPFLVKKNESEHLIDDKVLAILNINKPDIHFKCELKHVLYYYSVYEVVNDAYYDRFAKDTNYQKIVNTKYYDNLKIIEN